MLLRFWISFLQRETTRLNYSDDVKNDTLLLTISFEDVDELSAVENLLSHSSFVYNIDGKVIDVVQDEERNTRTIHDSWHSKRQRRIGSAFCYCAKLRERARCYR